MKKWTLFVAVMAGMLTGPIQASAQQTTTLGDLVAQCVSETRATGSYELVGNKSLQVQPGDGGTAIGARDVNDCLLDKRGVQFNSGKSGEIIAANGLVSAQECRRDRNGRIAVGLVLTAGVVAVSGDGAIYGGIAGSAVGIRKVNRDFRECLALAGQVDADVRAPLAIPVAGCRKRGGTLQNGDSICVGF